jgi:hypothetical protein
MFGFALAAAALVPAPAADAGQICLKVMLNGVVNHTAGQCVSVAPPTDCDSHLLQFPPSSSVTLLYCVPTPIAP